ncbi:MAG: hypothetical protein QHG99_08015 [Methanomicrobiales archaeon]|nr:hypothetical protein [Methanomicrobiales archaeon]
MVEKMEKIIEETSMKADQLKKQTAEALEEAAKRLRESGLSLKTEDVKRIIRDVEERMSMLREEVGTGIQKMESEYHARAEPVEKIIAGHPIPAVLVAAGLGFLLGALIFKSRD